MAPEEPTNSVKVSKEAFDVISNRIAIALARHESLIKSWTASSSLPQSTKTQEELDAEDAALFRNEPPHLGVGAPIPSHFLVSEAEQNTKSLRAKFFPTKGLTASKARNAEEKAASAKRGLNHESSDDEEGRSGLGRAKKQRTRSRVDGDKAIKIISSDADSEQDCQSKLGKTKKHKSKAKTTPTTQRIENTGTKSQKAENSHDDISMSSANALPTKQPLESIIASDAPQTNDGADRTMETEISGSINSQERKRMKKREKKRRAKLRAAEMASKL